MQSFQHVKALQLADHGSHKSMSLKHMISIQQFAIKAGEEINVSFDIDAHEYNGRWFNNVRAWNIQRVDAAAVQAGVPPVAAAPGQQAAPSSATAQTAPFPPAQPAEDSTDDLPF